MSKQDRQGVRTPAGLEQKYDLGKSLSNLEAKAKANAEQISKQGQRIDSISENQDERFSALEKGISIAEKNIDTLKENVNSLQTRMTNSEEHSLELENEVWSLARRITATEKVVEQLKQAQAVMVDINSLYKRFTPRNLLDNSDFEIAQAGYGGKHGAVIYAADRWMQNDATERVYSKTTHNGHGALTCTTETRIQQKLYLIEGEKYTATVVINGYRTTHVLTADGKSNGAGNLWVNYQSDGTYMFVIAGVAANSVISEPALYHGEYTLETLPEYQPTGYGAELAECQRYYLRIGSKEKNSPLCVGVGYSSTGMYAGIPGLSMRGVYSVNMVTDISTLQYTKTTIAAAQSVSSVSSYNAHTGTIVSLMFGGAFEAGTPYTIWLIKGVIEINADL